MSHYAVLHMETSGLSPARGGRVFELALVLVRDGRIADTCHSLLNPGLPPPPFLTTLTGVTPSMVREAPYSADVMAGLLPRLEGAMLVAHNVSIDRQIWQHELDLAGCRSDTDFLCTLRLARRLYPWAASQKIPVLAALQGISRSGHHKRALDAALLKAQIFARMLKDLSQLYPDENIDHDFLDRYQKTGRAMARMVPAPL